MKTSRIVFACLVVTFLANCDSGTPTEVVDPISDVEFAVTYHEKDVPWSQWWGAPLCGDMVWIEITDHWIYKYVETPSGRVLDSWRTNYKGTAVGTPSGNTWKISGKWGGQVNYDAADGEPYVQKYEDFLTLVGHGKAPNMRSEYVIRLKINANGEVTVDREFFNITCQGG
jgi:hypothetical protein